MTIETYVSRRAVLRGMGSALALGRLGAMQELPPHGISALLEGTGTVRIRAGEFVMGAAGGSAEEGPAHRVRIGHDFEIGKLEVTQAQWEAVISDAHAGPAAVRVSPQGAAVNTAPSHFKGPDLPVESVSWDDIQVFLARLNARDPTHTYRLPTEAEWEYACRAGKNNDPPRDLRAAAWYGENSEKHSQPVGQKEPNAWGLHDMYGNVAEWVHDWYAPNYYAESPADDPSGPASGSYRVFRGGCWFDADKYCRATTRRFDFPISRLSHVGFRLVRTVK
jgi:formylglycine-generating enzyme required for sulfatase activity